MLLTRNTILLVVVLTSIFLSGNAAAQDTNQKVIQNVSDSVSLGSTGTNLVQDTIIQDTAIEAPAHLQKLVETLTEQVADDAEDEIGLEIDGLIVKQTRTKAGNDFYDYFYQNWEPPPDARNYTILIQEKPYRFNLTIVTVKINDNEVFKNVLQPRNDIIVAMADYAISRASEFLTNYEEIMRQLGGEDQSGTGIY